ncbi:MAG: hypothetical protein U1D30_05655 [Planctomycetota bacterium]
MSRYRHRIVVSAQNSSYMAWQCKLLHYSSMSRLGQAPCFVLHDDNAELHPYFHQLVEDGAQVLVRPDYSRTWRGERYAPRNFPATVLAAAETAAEQCEAFVFCDPDMIFVQPPDFPLVMSADKCGFLDFDLPYVRVVIERLRLSKKLIAENRVNYNVAAPYVVPSSHAYSLARQWMVATDAFATPRWEDMMYGFGLSNAWHNVPVTCNEFANVNHEPLAPQTRPMLHYAYDSPVFSKRNYYREEDLPKLWDLKPEGNEGSVTHALFTQIAEARAYFESKRLF